MPVCAYLKPASMSFTMTMPAVDAGRKEKSSISQSEAASSASLLVYASAKCLGHLGFALSLIAVWLGWILPASFVAKALPPAPTDVKVSKPKRLTKSPRRPSLPPTTSSGASAAPRPPPTRRVSAPVTVDLTPILSTRAADNYPARRVYFADSPHVVSPAIRRNTTTDIPAVKAAFIDVQVPVVNSSPPSSPALPLRDAGSNHATSDTSSILQAPLEADTARPPSRSSLFRSSVGLQKLKFGSKTRCESLDRSNDQADRSSIASADTNGSDKSSRRFSGFSLTRSRNSVDLMIDPPAPSSRTLFRRDQSPARRCCSPTCSPLPSATDVLSPTFLSHKAQKRASAPIPRTMPYGAPYFATPPILLDDDNSSSHHKDEFKQAHDQDDDTSGSRKTSLDSESELSRGRSIRRIPLNATVPDRRPASIDLAQIVQPRV